jgi:hypothetical protein
MKNGPKFIQLGFSTGDSNLSRYMVLAEVLDQEVQRLHLIPIPSWLEYYSEKYIFYCINLN